MTDAFMRTFRPEFIPVELADTGKWWLRVGLATACRARWALQRDANYKEIQANETIPFENFHIASKRYAEKHAMTDIYIVADDDCLILGSSFVTDGVRILKAHPDYGMVSASSICDGYFLGRVFDSRDVVEMQCGGVIFVRRGILTEFENCDADKVDDAICREFNRKGYKTGVMPQVRFNHLGYGYSITSKGYWSA